MLSDRYPLLKWLTRSRDGLLILVFFLAFYSLIVWLINGGSTWWIIDFINGTNVFYGDDAYRFFLSKQAWRDADLYTYSFILPGALILDGAVATLVHGDLFWARMFHGLIAALALSVLWCAGRRLGIGRLIIFCAVLVMGLAPRYALTSLSFYGEFWLGACVCLMIWCFVSRHYTALALVGGLLPLLRPEGICFLLPLWIYMLKERRWKEAVLLLLPGGIYGLHLLYALPSLGDYSYWRQALRQILEKIAVSQKGWQIAETYSPLLALPALFGWLYAPVRKLWPVWVGGIIWLTGLQCMVLLGLATFEERYTCSVVPVLVLLWAGALAWGWQRMPAEVGWRGPAGAGVILLTTALLFQHFGQLTFVKLKVQQHGTPWVMEKLVSGRWGEIFPQHEPRALAARKLMANRIKVMLAEDPGIDKLVNYDPMLFYFLDAEAVPSHVLVGYPATSYMVFHLMLQGQIFIQHQRGKMYSYLRYGEPDFREGERRALYIDLMPLEAYPHTWRFNGIQYELYLFSYLESLTPDVDMETVPLIYPKDIENAYRQWVDD